MINKIKAQLTKSFETNSRSAAIDNLVKDIVSTIQLGYTLEDVGYPCFIVGDFIEDLQKAVDHHSEIILKYVPAEEVSADDTDLR